MSGLRTTIRGERLARALREAPEDLVRELDRAIGRSALEISRSARRRAPKAFSTLTQSIGVERPSRLEAIIAPHVDYAAEVELGRKPGPWPPKSDIRDWIRVRGISPRNPNHDLDDLTFLIVRKIGTQGTPSQPYMGPAYVENQRKVVNRMDQAIENVLRAI